MAILDIVRQRVGRRARITREEMTAILSAIDLPPEASTIVSRDAQGGLYVGRERVPLGLGEREAVAAAWARLCRDITCISVFAPRRTDDGTADAGCIRYDQPGSMHPLQHADLMFVAEALGEYEYDQIGQMRRHADRVLIVRD